MGLKQRLAAGIHLSNMFVLAVPLGVYIIIHDYNYQFLKQNCRTAINWGLTFWIYLFIAVAIVLNTSNPTIESSATIFTFGPHFIFCIIAAKKALNDQTWQYPLSISFI